MNIVELVVESAGIADGIAGFITAPEWGSGGAAVGADQGLTVDLVLVVCGASITCGGTTGTIAVTVARARASGGLVSGLGRDFLNGVTFQPGRTDGVTGLEIETTSVANRLSIRGSPP